MLVSVSANGRTIEYELTRKCVKNINLRVRPDGTVAVSAPMRTPQDRIDGFVLSRADRIIEAVGRARQTPALPEPSDDEVRACMLFVRSEVDRLFPYFASLGVAYPEIRFRHMTSQWGNCRTSENRVTFSTRLALLPRDCVSMVVAHEMCHFLHADHSAAFYAELEKIVPDYRELRKKMRSYR